MPYPIIPCPALMPVRQDLPRPRLGDVEEEAQRRTAPLLASIHPGARVAVTAGSRGINGISAILRGVSRAVRAAGAEPVIVAAMGSHGGGTPEGQRRILQELGITPESTGAPIMTSNDVLDLGRTTSGLTAWLDPIAASCDGILLVNRIKVHTIFREPFGSGLQKMIAIGLGHVPGAEQVHRRGPSGMAPAIAEVAAAVLATGKVIGGLAIVENGYDETAVLKGVPARRIAEREQALFGEANALMPRLPVDDIDVLIVDEMGKNFSGTGMDVNVTGRWRLPGVADPPTPHIDRLVVLRLSRQSEGNANGIAQADVCTQALVDAVDRHATYLNALTTTFVERVAIPMTMASDQLAISAALKTLSSSDPSRAPLFVSRTRCISRSCGCRRTCWLRLGNASQSARPSHWRSTHRAIWCSGNGAGRATQTQTLTPPAQAVVSTWRRRAAPPDGLRTSRSSGAQCRSP